MISPGTLIVGGVLGALVGIIWSEPFRDRRGRYTTRNRGFQSWMIQGVLGALIGAALLNATFPLIVANPLAGTVLLLAVAYAAYWLFVDPR